jgi:solute carrier family 25 uncoupling protein 8/9
VANTTTGVHLPPKYKGPFQTVVKIIEEEGMKAPFKGLSPGLHRQFLFTGLRLGLYEPIKHLFYSGEPGQEPLAAKVGAAMTTSALGITIAQPSDVLKVRFQAHNSIMGERPYATAFHGYRRIFQEEGLFAGLYRGYGPNLIRNIAISSTEIVTYDTTKHAILKRGYEDGLPVHLASAITAGFAATCVGSPADVVGTRLMTLTNSPGLASFCLGIWKNEGPGAFYKGFIPNFARLASFNIVLWLSYEKIREVMGIPMH